MAIKLKKSKKIRAFCYRLFAVGAFFVTVASGIMGKDALSAFLEQGPKLLYGKFYYLPEYETFMDGIYNQALAGYSTACDADSYSLTEFDADKFATQNRDALYQQIEKEGGSIVYSVRKIAEDTGSGNISFPIFAESDGHLLLPENIRPCYYWDGPNGVEHNYIHNATDNITDGAGYRVLANGERFSPDIEALENIRLIIGVRTDVLSGTLLRMSRTAVSYQIFLSVFFTGLILCCIFGLLSIFSRKAAEEAKRSYSVFTGKVPVEFKLICIALAGFLLYYYRKYLFFSGGAAQHGAYAALWVFFPTGCLFYLLWMDLKYNEEKVFVNSLPARMYRFFREYVLSRPWYRRAMAIQVCTLLSALVFLIVGLLLLYIEGTSSAVILGNVLHVLKIRQFLRISGILLIVLSVLLLFMCFRLKKFIRDMKTITARLSEMQEGICNAPLTLPAHSLLKGAAEDLNRLEDGIEKAVETKNRSNKLRVELLTNVSHDLKTPLTSIINYADLLCEEELPQTAADYAFALKGKAYRLKSMVQDVFDLSKAASGNLPVEKHRLDLVKLIRQTLADMNERIQAGTLTFKVTAFAEPVMIEADGEKLYRIFQNLFVNALQYSLENSRVHIQVSTENGYALAKVKNTSKWELDFDTQEILERFVRADASRTTEGSGLGLSIAQSFAETCGGALTVETDADMFIASVRFPLAQESSEAAAALAVPVQELSDKATDKDPEA